MDTQKNFGSPPAFQFTSVFDSEYIAGLYDADYVWIEEIFGTVLNTYNDDVSAIQQHLSENNLENLRKAVHKIKPAFGFIGMMQMQQKCQLLEDHCKSAASVSEVHNEAVSVLNECRQSQQVIQTEYERLKQFNSSTT